MSDSAWYFSSFALASRLSFCVSCVTRYARIHSRSVEQGSKKLHQQQEEEKKIKDEEESKMRIAKLQWHQ